MQQMVALPIIFIAIYIIITLLVGIFPFGRNSYKTVKDFHVAAGGMGFWIISIGIIVSFYSGTTWTGWQGFISGNGPLGAYIFPFIAASGILFYFLSERIQPVAKEKGLFTVGDYLEDKFDNRMLRFIGGILSFVTAVLWIVMDLITMGYVLTVVTRNSISMVQGEFFALIIILIYVLWGGIESIVWTDLLQGIIMIIGGALLCVYVVNNLFGDMEGFADAFVKSGSMEHYSLKNISLHAGREWMSLIVVSTVASVCFPATFVKMYMGKSINVLRKSGIMLSITALWSLVYFIPGLIIWMINKDEVGEEVSLLLMITNTGEILIICFAAVFILAVCIGSIDILLFTSSMCLMKDIGINIRGKKTAEGKEREASLNVLRGATIVTAVLVFLISALNQYALMDIALTSTQAIAQLFPAIIVAAYARGISSQGILLGLGSGVGIVIIFSMMNFAPFGIVPGFYGLIVNIAIILCFVVCSGKKSLQ